ncbi:Cell cycle checkpoint protein rad17, partial [Rhizoclosmatium hyalinum]
DELSIHKKKLADVRQWFIEALDPTSAGLRRLHKSHRLLALTGISGSAKTATVKFLSMELDFEIIEWINPINELQMDTTNDDLEESWTHPSTTKPYTTTPTLLQKFTDFITSA